MRVLRDDERGGLAIEPPDNRSARSADEGRRTPRIRFGSEPTADGLRFRGKVVPLFFWAHWCADCKAQAPILARLATKYRNQGVVLVGPTQRFGYVAGGEPAAADAEKNYIEQVRRTAYPALAGASIPLSAANHTRYGVSTTPTRLLVDRDGIVSSRAHRRAGPGDAR